MRKIIKFSGTVLENFEKPFWKYVAVGFLIAVVFSVGFLIFQNNWGKDSLDYSPVVLLGTGAVANVELGDSPVKGDIDAPVTMVGFFDYGCTFCEKFFSRTFGRIDGKYIKTGKVKFVFKDFPLELRGNSFKAAEAARCARDVGGSDEDYYEMSDALFEGGVNGGVELFKEYATGMGLDVGDFGKCLNSGKFSDGIREDVQQALNVGVEGTPTFFIGGKVIRGAQPYSVFEDAIENALKK